MIARQLNGDNKGITELILDKPIEPKVGAGGLTFENNLADFEYLITSIILQNKVGSNIKFKFNTEMYYLTMHTLRNEIEVDFDLLTGRISSITCKKGYTGESAEGIRIGMKMTDVKNIDKSIGFDLDHSFYVRYPFDGLIIYPPNELTDTIYSANVGIGIEPDFNIEHIEILEWNFALKHFKDTLID